MGEWKRVRLEDACEGIFDCPHSTAPDEGRGYPLIRTPNVGRGRLKLENVHRVSKAVYDIRNARAIPSPGDLIFAREAPAGNVACIQPDQWVCLGQRTVLIRPQKELLDSNYLAYYLLSPKLQASFGVLANGATVSHINIPDIRNLEVDLPPLPTQRRIAAVLGALDDKIEVNRKICENLEAQAQALFKAWFVDFEPFGGKRPEGWKMGKLGDVATIRRESITPDEMDEIVEHYSLPAFDESKFPAFDASESIKSNKFKIGKNSVLLSKLNPRIKRLWDPFVDTESAVASTEFVVFEPFKVAFRYFVYSVLDSEGLYQYSVAHAAGTTNSHQRVTPDDILEYEIVLPAEEDILKYCGVVEPMYASVKRRIKESRALAAMRDALLPKLMSGELAVEKVEEGDACASRT